MMSDQARIECALPSKTFLLGEYLVLNGGPSLLINTAPHFMLVAEKKPTQQTPTHAFAPDSPCARFIQQNNRVFKGYQLTLTDPFTGAGGFGASSAAFAGLFWLKHWLTTQTIFEPTQAAVEQVIAALQSFSPSQAILPSGADIAAQLTGHLVIFEKTKQLATANWPFQETVFCLLKSTEKVTTHQHLATLSLDTLPLSQLETIARAGIQALQAADERLFCQSINAYGQALIEHELATAKAAQQLAKIREQTGVKAAKGCGALAADVFFVMVGKAHVTDFMRWATPQFAKVIQGNQTAAPHFSGAIS
jgi:mevalonate kinase